MMPLAAVIAPKIGVNVREQESHGLLRGDGGRAHQGDVQKIAYAKPGEVIVRHALVQRVVHRARADLARQDGGDVLPAVLAERGLAVVLGVCKRRLRVVAGGLVDDLVFGAADHEGFCLSHM